MAQPFEVTRISAVEETDFEHAVPLQQQPLFGWETFLLQSCQIGGGYSHTLGGRKYKIDAITLII